MPICNMCPSSEKQLRVKQEKSLDATDEVADAMEEALRAGFGRQHRDTPSWTDYQNCWTCKIMSKRQGLQKKQAAFIGRWESQSCMPEKVSR